VGRSLKDRVAEYVDSERMRQRLKVGGQISCLIDGKYGAYRTQVSLEKRSESSCSCPSDYYPCKHVDALLQTYRVNPQSFLDFDVATNKKLAKMGRPELLQLIRRMVIAAPTSLSALDVKGFETENANEYYDP
jgi:uncharacterized Zn finger protein